MIKRIGTLILPAALLSCSSGGPGTVTIDGPPGGFGSGGENVIPAFGVISGGQPADSGAIVRDTAVTVPDTSNPADDAMCASKCPMDPDTAPAQITACKAAINGAKCASEYRAHFKCLADKRVCTEEGTTDALASSTACKTQQTTLGTCLGG